MSARRRIRHSGRWVGGWLRADGWLWAGGRRATFGLCALLAVWSCGGDQAAPDTPAALAVHSGDGQTATTGAAADEPVRVRVTSQSGAGLSGVSVSFEVTAGGGSVPTSSAVSDANGIASPGRWTMGAPGFQELRASVPGLAPVIFTATARGIPAEIVVFSGVDQAAPVGTAVPEAPRVLVTDRDGAAVVGIAVSFAAEGGGSVARAESATDDVGLADPGEWTLGTATGVYGLVASVEGDGVKGNPVRFEAVALPGEVASVEAVQGDGQVSEVKLPVRVPPRVRVRDQHGNAAAGARVSFVAGGGSQAVPTEAIADSNGVAGVDKWVLGTAVGATYRLEAKVMDEDSVLASFTFSAEATQAVYDIEIVHASGSLATDAEKAVFERAERFWERAIRGNLNWSTVRKPSLEKCLTDSGIDGPVEDERVVDDLLIYADVRDVDGPGRFFAGAGPCLIREDNRLPVAGVMFFDRVDLATLEAKGHLYGTILHEMAHVIGFGALWRELGLLDDPVVNGSGDPHFRGDSAVAAFPRVGGAKYPEGPLVPVENLAGPGVWNGHWRESVFRTELMTGFVNAGANPLSLVSIASFADLGYEDIDYSVAEDFTLPDPDAAPSIAPDAPNPAGAAPTDLGDDVLRLPVVVIDRDGNAVRRVPPRGARDGPSGALSAPRPRAGPQASRRPPPPPSRLSPPRLRRAPSPPR